MPSYKNPDDSYFDYSSGGPVRVVAPSTGDTLAMKIGDRSLYVNNSSTLAALTVKLPRGMRPGEFFHLAFKGTITTLTVQTAAAGSITGAPTSGAANAARIMRWVNATIGWVLWK